MLRPILASLALLLAGAALAADTAAPGRRRRTRPSGAEDRQLLDRVVAVVNDGVVTAERAARSRWR